MSLLGKLSLALSGVSLIIVTPVSFILGAWPPVLNIFLALFVLGILFALIVDYKLYLGFLTMKTTKNGMSMGVSVLITLIFCASLAYLSMRFEKSVDITEEKINSLAPQTVQLLESLKENMRLTVFYIGAGGHQKKELVKNNLRLIKQNTSKVKIRYYDAHLKNRLAQEYLNEIPNKEREDIFVFVEYKGKKVLVEFPFDEEKLTSAMINTTRRGTKIVYFLSGHGERDLSNQTGSGISHFKEALTRSSFQVREWNFLIDGKLPDDISALVIAGPQRPYMEKEVQWLEEYLEKGGKALIALDPDTKHNLKDLLKKFNVNYTGHYIMDLHNQEMLIFFGGYASAGVHFDTENKITRAFHQRGRDSYSIFYVVSNLEIENNDKAFLFTELVKSNVKSFSTPDPNIKSKKDLKQSSYILGLLIEKEVSKKEEKNDSEKSEKKQDSTALAVFGDSDFLSNHFINKGINRDLVMNAVSYLVDESDLVSIRPKRLKATQLVLTGYDRMMIIISAVFLPIIFFICSFIIWLRRSAA